MKWGYIQKKLQGHLQTMKSIEEEIALMSDLHDVDLDNPNDWLKNQVLHEISRALEYAKESIHYSLSESFEVEGFITRKPNGAYAINNTALQDGDLIEVLIADPIDIKAVKWVRTKLVQIDKDTWMLAKAQDVSIQGLFARIRDQKRKEPA